MFFHFFFVIFVTLLLSTVKGQLTLMNNYVLRVLAMTPKLLLRPFCILRMKIDMLSTGFDTAETFPKSQLSIFHALEQSAVFPLALECLFILTFE